MSLLSDDEFFLKCREFYLFRGAAASAIAAFKNTGCLQCKEGTQLRVMLRQSKMLFAKLYQELGIEAVRHLLEYIKTKIGNFDVLLVSVTDIKNIPRQVELWVPK